MSLQFYEATPRAKGDGCETYTLFREAVTTRDCNRLSFRLVQVLVARVDISFPFSRESRKIRGQERLRRGSILGGCSVFICRGARDTEPRVEKDSGDSQIGGIRRRGIAYKFGGLRISPLLPLAEPVSHSSAGGGRFPLLRRSSF